MYPPIRCKTCGSCIGPLIPLYQAMRADFVVATVSKKLNISPEDVLALPAWRIESYADMHVETTSIFEALKVERYCCRSDIMTCSTEDTLMYY